MESIDGKVQNICMHSGNRRQWSVKVCPYTGFTVYTILQYKVVKKIFSSERIYDNR